MDFVQKVIASFIAAKILIMIIGLLGNLLVILVIVNTKRLHTRVYALLVNLAAADLMSLVICVPHSILQEFRELHKPDLLCKLAFGFEHLFTMASSLTIAVIALERLVVIWMPLRGPSLLGRNSLRAAVMLALWLVSLLVTLPFFWHAAAQSRWVPSRKSSNSSSGFGRWNHVCVLPKTPSGANVTEQDRLTVSILGLPPETFYIVSTCLELYLPMHLIVLLYAAIFYKLLRSFRRLGGGARGGVGSGGGVERRKSNSQQQHHHFGNQDIQMHDMQPEQQQQQQLLQQLQPRTTCRVNNSALIERKRVVYFSLLVAIVYFLTVAPFRSVALCMANDDCFNSLQRTMGQNGLFISFQSLAILLYANHCLNPVLYNLASRRFRRATGHLLRSVLQRWCRCCFAGGGAAGGAGGFAAGGRNGGAGRCGGFGVGGAGCDGGCGGVGAGGLETRTLRATTRRTKFKSRTNNCELQV